MNYTDLVQLYFERSTALQLYWTLYVAVIGGLLAFSSLRQRKDAVTVALVSVLYLCFAYKNLGAVEDVTRERFAVMTALKAYAPAPSEAAAVKQLRDSLEPTLDPTDVEGVRHFHVGCDLLTIAALWAMEWRRRRAEASTASSGSP